MKCFQPEYYRYGFFILSAVANASVSTKYPETIRFPKDLGPVQFFETPTRYMRFIKYIEKQLSFQ